MALRLNANGQSLSSTTSLPGTSFSATCLVKLATDRNAISGLFSLLGSPGLSIQTTVTGTQLETRPSGGGSASSSMGSLVVGTWMRFAMTYNAGALTFLLAAITSALPSTTASTCGPYSALTGFRLGASHTSTDFVDATFAAVKMWSGVLSTAALHRELMTYLPARTSDLIRFHPFVKGLDLADHSGNGGVLTGGVGAVVEDGPPIPWRGRATPPLEIPWDPTSAVWLAIYDTATGALVSGDYASNVILPLPEGLASKEYLGGPPDMVIFEWDPVALDFVYRAGVIQVDRVYGDLTNDATLAASWAAMTPQQSDAMKARIALMLGPHRYRFDFQEPDLQAGFGA